MAELPKDHFRRCGRPFYLVAEKVKGCAMSRKSSQSSHFCWPSGKGLLSLVLSMAMVFLAVLMAKEIAFVQTLPVPAFPGAEGFGAKSVGGRGGIVIEVTNLNDSGPGSLRAAIEATGPRTVVFRIGGTVELQSSLEVTNPYITIAGQTAPGGGITLKNDTNTSTTLSIQTHDVIIQYLRVRPGPGGEPDGINIVYNESYNVILDHCSVSWAVDENINTWYGTYDITIQWCLISEALRLSTHSEGSHSCGLLVGSDGSHSISVHHNLFVHNDGRNPMIKTSGVVDFVNNVIYNYGHDVGYLYNDFNNLPVNYVDNYVIMGADSQDEEYELEMYYSKNSIYDYSVYVHGNIGPHRPDDTYDESAVVSPEDRLYLIDTPHPTTPITTTSAQEAFDHVLGNAGATIGIDGQGHSYWRRDPVDSRVVNDVLNGTGQIIDDPEEVGGWPELETGLPPADSDHDGMPDEWEEQNGFDPADSTDGPADADGDGYTNLEAYLYSLSPPDTEPPVVTEFDLPDDSSSLMVPIITFTATDNMEVTGYLVTESSAVPAIEDSDWNSEPPGSYTFGAAGSQTLYGWAKDAADNISAAASDTVTIADTAPPTVTAFDLPETATIMSVPVLVFTATDDFGVTGYLATETANTPAPYDLGWQATAPTTHTFSSAGSHTLYGWAKDAAANVSVALSDTVAIDTQTPLVTVFVLPATHDELQVPLTFTATDDTEVTGYLVKETSDVPAADDPTWQSIAPSAHTFGAAGSQTLYGWAKDAAGNISATATDTVDISLPDTEPPEVTAFDLPATHNSLTVPLQFEAYDVDSEVIGFLVKESSAVPAVGDPNWQISAPASYTFSAEGSQTLYGWAKDAAGNISATATDTVAITLPDIEAPTVDTFGLPATHDNLTVPIVPPFTASDNIGVTGYLTSESNSTPSAADPGWTDPAPTTHTFSAVGSQTLYGWAKDAAGNISTAASATVVITLADTTPPVVTAFDLPDIYDSLTVPLQFDAYDVDSEVSGYLVKESSAVPAVGDPNWQTNAPTTHTFGAAGSQTLYGWAKDTAGNISAMASDSVVISLVTTLHLGDLDGSVKVRGSSGKWVATVTVTVHDQNHSPVTGASVSGMWSGDVNGTVSGTTNDLGIATFGTGKIEGGSTIAFEVTGVNIANYTYDASVNHDPDGDSDGTSITLSKP